MVTIPVHPAFFVLWAVWGNIFLAAATPPVFHSYLDEMGRLTLKNFHTGV